MRPRVIADLVTFAKNAAYQARKFLGFVANDEERGLGVHSLQRVEYLWRVLRVGTIVKRERYLLVGCTVLVQLIRQGQVPELLAGDQAAGFVYLYVSGANHRTAAD